MARILLVEDDVNVRLLLEHVLRGEGHDVDPVATVQQALSRIQQRGYDLVVADGKLPDGTGMTVGDAATAEGVKTLIITGFALLPREELMRFDYLLKPVRPAELIKAIDRKLASAAPPAPAPQ
jgi:DNA-binding NtrC family response regulator